jgi:tetratricopeptide (TPR) repeat protein
MIYQDLANYYLEKERYEDSAATLRSYVERYRNNDKSPELHRQLIASYVAGGFPQQAREEKASYIDYYYDNQTIGDRADIEKNIQQYIQQLASFYHGSGQQLMAEAERIEQSNKHYKKIHSQALADFSAAAAYYQRYIDYYPSGKRVAEYTFLTAETYFSAQQYAQAIAAYEQVAYVMGNTGSYAADAGYAAIVAYQQQIDGLAELNITPVVNRNTSKVFLIVFLICHFIFLLRRDVRRGLIPPLGAGTSEHPDINVFAVFRGVSRSPFGWTSPGIALNKLLNHSRSGFRMYGGV